MNPDFWRGKRVFLTGHTGFKGAWLSLWLQQLGAEVTGFALQPPTSPNLFELAKVGAGMQSVIGDIRDAQAVLVAVQQAKPEILIHMAAQPLVRYSYQQPVETYATNVMGTVHLLEAVRQTDTVRAVLNVTSDKCYENREWAKGYRENDAMGGFDPYSSSKGCAELVTAAYRNSYFHPQKYQEHGVAVATARAGNVIGGGDWAQDRLIPDVVWAWQNQMTVQIRNPQAIRPWQHVFEPLSGYLLLLESLYNDGGEYAEAWNFGPAEEDMQAVRYIVEAIRAYWPQTQWDLDQASHRHEENVLKLDSSKAIAKLGWRRCWGLSDALAHTLAWYQAAQQNSDMAAFSHQQLQQFYQTHGRLTA